MTVVLGVHVKLKILNNNSIIMVISHHAAFSCDYSSAKTIAIVNGRACQIKGTMIKSRSYRT